LSRFRKYSMNLIKYHNDLYFICLIDIITTHNVDKSNNDINYEILNIKKTFSP